MLGRIVGRKTSVPNLVVAQRVIDHMMAAAQSYLEDETGEAMVGIVAESAHGGTPTLYVLDTIAPDSTAIRHYHTFQQGDERQDEILYWWRENWRAYRAALPADDPLKKKWDAPLHHLGDWHKQPGFMIQPSMGDLMTALEWIADSENALGFMLAPIVTLGHESSNDAGGVTTSFLLIPDKDGTNVRVDWWFIDLKSRGFVPITPTVYPDDQLPALPAIPWHLSAEERFDLECRRLKDYGIFLSLSLWNADDQVPLDVCLLTARADWDHMLLLITPHDYPAHPPRARIAPFIPMGEDDDLYQIFEQAWAQSHPIEITPETWSDQRWLIDYVKEIAAAKNLSLDVQTAPADPPPVAESAVIAEAAPAPELSADTAAEKPAETITKADTASGGDDDKTNASEKDAAL